MRLENDYELSGLTGRVCDEYARYLTNQVTLAIRSHKEELGDEYALVLVGHFQSLAIGAYDPSLSNPLAMKFLKEKPHVVALLWLMLTAKNPQVGEVTAAELYERNQAEVDAWIIAELEKKNPTNSAKPSSASCSEKSA